MIQFARNPECTACPLHEQCKTRCIPTRALDLEHPEPFHPRALLVIGEAPGGLEDDQGVSWVGWTGKLLTRFLVETYSLPSLIDIYLTNACRCRPPSNNTPTQGQLKRCKPYLHRDILALLDHYGPTNLVLLCLGGPATYTISASSIKKRLPYQGVPIIPFLPPKADPSLALPALPTFYTYHPAAMSPGRKPELVHTFDSHLKLLTAYLSGSTPAPCAETIRPLIAPDRLPSPPILSLDIETYGILEGMPEQTVFNPHRSRAVDGVPYHRQIVSVALSWPSPSSGGIKSAYYNFQNRGHRDALFLALLRLPRPTTMVGQNIPFDLLYLRTCWPSFSVVLNPHHFRLEDTSILNHLHTDTRPERSLKALSHLLGTANYHTSPVSTLPTGSRALSPLDPNLIHYNCLDTISTLRLYLRFTSDLKARWKPPLPTFDRDLFRSNLVWITLHMSEAGLCFSIPALQSLADRLEAAALDATTRGSFHGYTLGGKGSGTSRTALILKALTDSDLLGDSRVKLTEKTKRVSTAQENVQLLLAAMPLDAPLRPAVQAFQDYQAVAHVRDSYTTPLLTSTTKGCLPTTHSTARAYPSWYPVPSAPKDTGGSEGGTRQGRFAAHNPAAQTMPPEVKATQVSRYPGGCLISYDLSQIELRVPALLSNDPEMCAIYREHRDAHHEAAALIWPGLVRTRGLPAYESKRQLGKTLNFLTQFRGGAHQYTETVRKDYGIETTEHFAQSAIDAFWARRRTLWNWQQSFIDAAIANGYLELPTGWRRTFIRDRYLVQSSYISEICNFPVQTLAAQILQSVQAAIILAKNSGHPDSLDATFMMPAQIHDDILLDVAPESVFPVHRFVCRLLANPPLWDALCRSLGRRIPMAFEVKLLSGPSCFQPYLTGEIQ